MKKLINVFLTLALLSSSACTTLNQSVKLGATIGTATGVAAVHAGYNDAGVKPDSSTVLTGAAVGLALGVLTSYITHKEIDKDRYKPTGDPDTYFGDLPPNPFIINMNNQGGN
ncbi:MAG: hypothetical protein KDD50_12360 [Bdellovibrionales bacterium]|nr:hypothetical protein [Bdellovibrionales bacterium]